MHHRGMIAESGSEELWKHNSLSLLLRLPSQLVEPPCSYSQLRSQGPHAFELLLRSSDFQQPLKASDRESKL